MLFGAHCAGGIKKALDKCAGMGAEVVQLFVQSPRTWRFPNHDPADLESFRAKREEAGVPAFVHALYLVNLAAPDKDVYGKKEDFPIVCTTYRLTEHFHYWTQHQHDGVLNELQPGFFVEIPEGLANQKGITNGSKVKVTSARGSIEGTAMVTKRLYPLKIDGKEAWQIGFPIHWGYAGDPKHTGPLANLLTPSAMDPNTWTPEFKAFLVRVEKA